MKVVEEFHDDIVFSSVSSVPHNALKLCEHSGSECTLGWVFCYSVLTFLKFNSSNTKSHLDTFGESRMRANERSTEQCHSPLVGREFARRAAHRPGSLAGFIVALVDNLFTTRFVVSADSSDSRTVFQRKALFLPSHMHCYIYLP